MPIEKEMEQSKDKDLVKRKTSFYGPLIALVEQVMRQTDSRFQMRGHWPKTGKSGSIRHGMHRKAAVEGRKRFRVNGKVCRV